MDISSSSSSSSSTSRISENGTVLRNQGKGFDGIQNPFAFKAFQVFTGFGVGCGVGIGAGSPLNLGSIPMVGQVLSSARGATDAFSGVSRHVNNALRKLGAKNIQAGIGCGVGFGHGFGVGLAIKPGAVHKLQSFLVESAAKSMTRLGMTSNLPIDQSSFPTSLQSGLGIKNEHSSRIPSMQEASEMQDKTAQVLSGRGKDASFQTASGTRTEEVISRFLENPILKQQGSNTNEMVGRLQSENNMLQMVLKHQKLIEQLMEENEKLYKVLVEDLKVPPNRLKLDLPGEYRNKNSPCRDCFECRRKQKRSR